MKKVKLKTKYKLIIALIVFCLVLFSSFNIYTNYKNFKSINSETEKEIEKPVKETETISSLSLLATGDALIHSGIYKAAYHNGIYDFNSMFSEVTDIIKSYDIAFINQETPFADAPASNYPRFNTPKEWGDAMINAGFNMFSLANNHSMDMFETGIIDTINYWSAKENIYYSGMNISFEEQSNIKIENKNGISYAMIAYTEHTNGLAIPNGKEYLVNMYSKDQALKDINSIKDKVDVIIVSMHWGDEYTAYPNDYQKTVAKELSSMDVDIVLGNHPHWTQPIEIIDDTVIVYSMGNFISNQMTIAHLNPYTDSVKVGAFVIMNINKINNNIIIDNINVELIYCYNSSSTGFKVIPFSKMNKSYDSEYLNLYEEHKLRMQSMSDKVKVNSLSS